MATKTAEKKTPAKKSTKAPVAAKPKPGKGAAVAPVTPAADAQPVKAKRERKNETVEQLVTTDPKSAEIWLNAFRTRTQKPRKGYDQHWNELGMIHDGIRARMSVQGMGRTIVLVFDALAAKAAEGDVEAQQMIDFCGDFGKNRHKTLKAAKEAEILAEAARITASHAKA